MKDIGHQTLTQLERCDWGEPEYDSHLVTTCHRLRHKPVQNFSVEDLRIMIGQNIGLKYLLPMAVDILQTSPVIAGDFYPGDLLQNVVRCDSALNLNDKQLQAKICEICTAALKQFEQEPELGPVPAEIEEFANRTCGST